MSWKDFWRRLNQSCKLSTSSPFQPTLSSQRPHNFTKLLEAERSFGGDCQGSLVPPMMASIGIHPLKRKKFASKVLPQHVAGFCQWGRKVGMALEKMDVVSFKRANFPSSLLFFLLVSFFLKSWKFQLTWLDVFECKFLPKKNVLIQRSPLNTRPRITSGILMGFLSTGLGDPQLLPKFS